MKTKLTLTILSVYNLLLGLICMFFSEAMSKEFVNSVNPDVIQMGSIFHIGLGHAIFLVGLILFFSKNSEYVTARKILLSYIIGISILFYIFFGVMANQPLVNFSPEHVIPDFIFFCLAIVGYIKAK